MGLLSILGLESRKRSRYQCVGCGSVDVSGSKQLCPQCLKRQVERFMGRGSGEAEAAPKRARRARAY